MRLTLDSNILVRALISPRGPALRLLNIVLGKHTLVLSRFILDEVQRVLLYPRLHARNGFTADEGARFAGKLADIAELVEPQILHPLSLADPDDDPVLYTAGDGHADILCTLNLRHFRSPEVQAYCEAQRFRVMTDLDALREVADPETTSFS